MEKMPYQPGLDVVPQPVPLPVPDAPSNDWRTGLPTLTGSRVMLRDLRMTDAETLFAAVSSDEASRFISPPPACIAGFERFIAWSHRQRQAGQCVAFAIVPRGSDTAIGLFQVRSFEPDFGTAEWGFALAPEFWGAGLFVDGARLVIDFAFDVIGAHRLEARASLKNGRGNGALRKLGAVQEGVLRRSFLRNGEFHDQMLWTILAEEWREAMKSVWGSDSVVH